MYVSLLSSKIPVYVGIIVSELCVRTLAEARCTFFFLFVCFQVRTFTGTEVSMLEIRKSSLSAVILLSPKTTYLPSL
jgi:hypothetical protein